MEFNTWFHTDAVQESRVYCFSVPCKQLTCIKHTRYSFYFLLLMHYFCVRDVCIMWQSGNNIDPGRRAIKEARNFST